MLLSYLSAFLETSDHEIVSCSSSCPFIGFPGDRGYGFRITYPLIKILWIQMFCVWELLCNSLTIINFWIIIHWIIVVITYLWPGGCHVGWIQFQNKCYFFSHTVHGNLVWCRSKYCRFHIYFCFALLDCFKVYFRLMFALRGLHTFAKILQ